MKIKSDFQFFASKETQMMKVKRKNNLYIKQNNLIEK